MQDHPPKGRPDYHDPTAGFGGAPQAYSALTLRAVLAGVGLVMCGLGAAATAVIGDPGWVIAFSVLGAIALIDLAVIAFRKHRGEPG